MGHRTVELRWISDAEAWSLSICALLPKNMATAMNATLATRSNKFCKNK